MRKILSALILGSMVMATAAHAGNRVSVIKDKSGKDQTLKINLTDRADTERFGRAFPEVLDLTDSKTGQKLFIRCASSDCGLTYEDQAKKYRQQLDEARRSVEFTGRNINFALWDGMNVPAINRGCVPSDAGCTDFYEKILETEDGRLALRCIRRSYDDNRGVYTKVDCSFRYSLQDLFE